MIVRSVFQIKYFKDEKYWAEQSVLHKNMYRNQIFFLFNIKRAKINCFLLL